MKIAVAVAGLSEAHRRRLQAALEGHTVCYLEGLPEGDRRRGIAEAEVVFGNVPPAWLEQAPRLRWVQLDSAGVQAYVGFKAARSPAAITFTHLRDFYGVAVTEAAVAGILAFYRQLPRLLAAQRDRRWVKPEVEPAIGQLRGARVVTLGAGSIGRRLGTVLQAFGCEVRFFARGAPAAQLHTLAELDVQLASTDILINTLPQTPQTVGLLDRDRLRRLPPTALLVNVGRGSVLDERALVEALDSGRLAGAVLDVTAVEPLPRESPFWLHPRVILTQHTAGRFPRETDEKITRFLGNFDRYQRGERLADEVDMARGY
ncbi:MAG TPA: D-2-hydroxyacid dehydrogenase [Candidatus Baltobacteraceae bacterium]|nr:D-2-hydroxyacid dehydrogenase [Candidatus Baltobacteraceae bacterium]